MGAYFHQNFTVSSQCDVCQVGAETKGMIAMAPVSMGWVYNESLLAGEVLYGFMNEFEEIKGIAVLEAPS